MLKVEHTRLMTRTSTHPSSPIASMDFLTEHSGERQVGEDSDACIADVLRVFFLPEP